MDISGADPRMVRIGTGPPFWQINHVNSAYFRLFLGYFRVISAIRPPFWISAPSFYISWIHPCILKILKKEYEDKIQNILPLLEEMNALRRKIFWDFETTSF